MTDNTYPNLSDVDNIYRQNKAIIDAAAEADRTKAMDELIAGDADLYDVPETIPLAWRYERKSNGTVVVEAPNNRWASTSGWTETPLYASARITGDKDRENPVERPHEPEYDHKQDGTANFDRALLYASYHEVESERLTKALHRANAQTEQFERDYYLKCDEHERDMKDAVIFMGKRDAQIEALTELAHQYLSDLRYPTSADSKERRIERIEAVLKEVEL